MIAGFILGNSSLKFGLYDGRSIVHSHRIPWARLMEEGRGVRDLLLGRGVSQVIAGSVRDDLLTTVEDLIPNALRPVRLARRDFGIPMANLYEVPESAGTDRLLGCLAARNRHPGNPVIVVDFGTATSLSVVSAAGEFLGGIIAAGGEAILDGLSHRAPRLPQVELVVPQGFIQRTTRAAMQCGICWQVAGGVSAMIRGLSKEISSPSSIVVPRVLATGGGVPLYGNLVPEIDQVIPDLTLEGLFAAHG